MLNLIKYLLRKGNTETYSKLTLLCLTVTFIGVIQILTVIYPILEEGYSNKLEYESSILLEVDDIVNYTCDVKNTMYKSCGLAKIQINTGRVWLKIFSIVLGTSFLFGGIFLLLSIQCWLSSKTHDQNK